MDKNRRSENIHLKSYFEFLLGRVWKILPMKEEKSEYLKDYIKGLQREVKGSISLIEYEFLGSYLIMLLHKLEFLIDNQCEHSVYRKEVFECVNIVKKIINSINANSNV